MKKYLFDTSVFITAFRTHYPPQIMPSFWDSLKGYFIKCRFYVTNEVCKEVQKHSDWLRNWLKSLPRNKILNSGNDRSVMLSYKKIVKYLKGTTYQPEEIDKFLNEADAYLIAHALADSRIVIVTYEKLRRSKRKPYIPDICEQFGLTVSISLQSNYEITNTINNISLLGQCRCICLTEALRVVDFQL